MVKYEIGGSNAFSPMNQYHAENDGVYLAEINEQEHENALSKSILD